MIVCIAEKPSVAKDIARVLGAATPHDGYMEGNGYQVTWTFGHLCSLKEPEDYTERWRPWTLSRLPMIPERFGIKLIPNKTYERQFHIIETLLQAADGIVNCGDAGQEGELIQRWVMQKAKAACPVQRLWISSLTEESIREGFNTLRPQNDYLPLYQAGLCRAIGDWLLGMNATRLYTLKYSQGSRQVLSIGRVQTPTLALIVNKQHEINSFKPEQYWLLATKYRETLFNLKTDGDSESDDATKLPKGRFSKQEMGLNALESIRGKEFHITVVSKKDGIEHAPRLFDLTSLQVECNKKYSFSAEETLKLIQSLYEKKATTYPRVDTTYLNDDIYPKCPQILEGLVPYADYVVSLKGKALPKTKRVFDNSKVTDHHAIIPTGVNPVSVSMSREEKMVFDLIARRFIAVFYPDCKVSNTTVMGNVENLTFSATGKQILVSGWRVVFDKMDKNDDEDGNMKEEKALPDFKKGEHGLHEPILAEKWTTPPKPYTEATLLRAMETAGRFVEKEELRDALKENGIGRPSTRAAIIETLFKRGYVRKERKNLIATQTGMDLIGIIHEELLKSAELTGQWEKKLREIEACNYSAVQFIEELKQMVTQLVQQVLNDNSTRQVAAMVAVEEPHKVARKLAISKVEIPSMAPSQRSRSRVKLVKEGDACPLCGKGVVIAGHSALGCSEWKNGCIFRQPFPKRKKGV
ncbi:MAG: DNA topoisomerase 3 [Bacteroidales bacterium]|nr:DNA topoisomerase 3 [Bacteroidales bacterium]